MRSAVVRRDLSTKENVTVHTIIEILKNTAGAQTLLGQVCRLTKLLLVLPATSATAERHYDSEPSFSKNVIASYDGPAETEQFARILHCHQDRADRLNLKAISQEFVCTSEQRSKFFGN